MRREIARLFESVLASAVSRGAYFATVGVAHVAPDTAVGTVSATQRQV